MRRGSLMESVPLADGWEVELSQPECDNCGSKATKAVRMHDCVFRITCDACAGIIMCNVMKGYNTHSVVKCQQCRKPLTLTEFIEVSKL